LFFVVFLPTARPSFLLILCPQIRVVNAFRQGLDASYGESLAEVLRKQPCFSKRLSAAAAAAGGGVRGGTSAAPSNNHATAGTTGGGSIEYADGDNNATIGVPHIDVERLSSHSHTETAV